MYNVISSQRFKYLRSSVFFVILCTAPCLAYIFFRISRVPLSQIPAGDAITGADIVIGCLDGGFIMVLIGILASLLICADFTTQSIRQIIGKGTSRLSYTLGTIITCSVFCLGIMLLYSLCNFGFGAAYYGQAGLDKWKTLLWLLLAIVCLAFFYTAYIMFIASLSKRASVTIPLAVVTPSLSELLVMSFATKSMKQYPIDPLAVFNNIYLHDHKICPRIYSAIALIVAGIIFTILSIIVVKKKEY